MHRPDRHIVLPTIWGYATLLRGDGVVSAYGDATRRVDTVLSPTLTQEELADFHDRLLQYPGGRRLPRETFAQRRRIRRALREAVDVRTTVALRLGTAKPELTPGDVVFSTLVRAMCTATSVGMDTARDAFARQLVWSAILAVNEGDLSEALDAAVVLRWLAAAPTGSTPLDRVDL